LLVVAGLVLAAMFLEESQQTQPSQLADTFGSNRNIVSHAVSSLEAKGLLQRRIDPVDARGYVLTLRSAGKKCTVRVVDACLRPRD
jgi:DNA-binding MarR family transcriptional regulator